MDKSRGKTRAVLAVIFVLTIGIFVFALASIQPAAADLQITNFEAHFDGLGHPVLTGYVVNNDNRAVEYVHVYGFVEANGVKVQSYTVVYGPIQPGLAEGFTITIYDLHSWEDNIGGARAGAYISEYEWA